MKRLLILLSLLVTVPCMVDSVYGVESYLVFDSTMFVGDQQHDLINAWRYRMGDSIAWKDPIYSDTSWIPLADPSLPPKSSLWLKDGDVMWLRIHCMVDSFVASRPMMFQIWQGGLLRIFLDGNEIYGPKDQHVTIRDSSGLLNGNEPVLVPVFFKTKGPHCIAVRYSTDFSWLRRHHFYCGFAMLLSNPATGQASYNRWHGQYTFFRYFFGIPYCILSVAFFILFLVYRSDRTYVRYGIFTLLLSVINFCTFASSAAFSMQFTRQLLHVYGLILIVTMLYGTRLFSLLFNSKVSDFFLFLAGLAVIAVLAMPALGLDAVYGIATLLCVEQCRIVVRAFIQKKPGARLVGTGAFLVAIIFIFYFLVQMGVLPVSWGYTFPPELLGTPVLLLTMSAYLAIQHQKNFKTQKVLAHEQEKLISDLNSTIIEREQSQERRQHQQREMFQARKMARLGTLVSMVTQEMRMPAKAIGSTTDRLSAIWNRIHTLLISKGVQSDRYTPGAMSLGEINVEMEQLIDNIKEGNHRIEGILTHLTDFSERDARAMHQPVDLSLVVKSAVAMVSDSIRKSTRFFNVSNRCDGILVKGNSLQLEQVVVNLILNACQALDSSEQEVNVSIGMNAVTAHAFIQIRDQGIGIPADILSRVFDPFFTSKREKGGTGLGLFMAYTIIKRHLGEILIESNPRQGTTVTVTLPLSAEGSDI